MERKKNIAAIKQDAAMNNKWKSVLRPLTTLFGNARLRKRHVAVTPTDSEITVNG